MKDLRTSKAAAATANATIRGGAVMPAVCHNASETATTIATSAAESGLMPKMRSIAASVASAAYGGPAAHM